MDVSRLTSKEVCGLYFQVLFTHPVTTKESFSSRSARAAFLKLCNLFTIPEEAIAVGTTFALNKNDYILPMHRNLGVFTTRELDLEKLFSQLMGKEGGFTKGRDRTFHFGIKDKNIIGMISHLAAMLPVGVGY